MLPVVSKPRAGRELLISVPSVANTLDALGARLVLAACKCLEPCSCAGTSIVDATDEANVLTQYVLAWISTTTTNRLTGSRHRHSMHVSCTHVHTHESGYPADHPRHHITMPRHGMGWQTADGRCMLQRRWVAIDT